MPIPMQRVARALTRARPSLAARPHVRPTQTQRFLSTAHLEHSTQSNRRFQMSKWLIQGLGIGIGWGVAEAYFRRQPLRAEAIDLGDSEESETPAKLKPRRSKSKPKSKPIEKEDATDNPILSETPSSESPSPAPSDTDAESHDGGNSAAFNPETGEINWDCPCLGGMAHGPCGEEFRAAFSCFVYSEAEPKGIECVEKFKGMQDCFREHPEVYGEDIMADDEEDGPAPTPSGTDSPALESDSVPHLPEVAGSPSHAPVPGATTSSSAAS